MLLAAGTLVALAGIGGMLSGDVTAGVIVFLVGSVIGAIGIARRQPR